MYGLIKRKPVKNVEVGICPPQEKPAIGKVCSIDVLLHPQQEYFFKYVLFDLVNERTDKRAPMDRITSRSEYFYRFNVDKPMGADHGEKKYTFQLRIPVHKEPSRNDKFICIKWQLGLEVVLATSEENAELLGAPAPIIELEVV